jgi:hypothetical protein
MIYKPSYGKFKDNCVFWHEGRFFLFSMFMKDGGEYRNVWLAESTDGVHWTDVGAVIEDSKFLIWAMGIHQAEGRFILNHGSFGENGAQNVLKFWQSSNLYDWEYMGESSDVSLRGLGLPDDARLDAMNVIKTSTGYYGYATGPSGFLASADGLQWRFCDTKIEFGDTSPPPTPYNEGVFEVGGCGEIDGSFFYLGGWFNYMGRKGYGVYSLRSDSPCGPFKPDSVVYRLSGNSERWVSLWARFCATDTEMLVNGYMQQGYSYENGDTWMPPLKKAVVNRNGHLRLGYWPGNDALIGQELYIDDAKWLPYDITESETATTSNQHTTQDARSIKLRAREYPSFAHCPVEASMALLSETLDAEVGFIVSGTINAQSVDTRLVSPSVGIVMEESEGDGTVIWLHGYGLTEIGKITWKKGYHFDCEDTISSGCAAPAGIVPNQPHRFILLVRKCMYEFYLDDWLVQTLNTTHSPNFDGIPPQRIGFIARNGACEIQEFKINRMSL